MSASGQTRLKVIDAMDHPHRGRVLRLRLLEGASPTVKQLKGARLEAQGPRGEARSAVVLGFPVFYGKVSDTRIRETGRIDVHVDESGEGEPIGLTWTVRIS
jgi:hypothetical protein